MMMLVHRAVGRASLCTRASFPVSGRALVRPVRRPTSTQAQQQQQEQQQQQQPAAAATPRTLPPRPVAGPPGTIMGPDGKPLKVVSIEKAGEEAWAGVAAIDKGDAPTDSNKPLLLAAGDVSALLIFAAVGRMNHGEAVDAETLLTALPFVIGWFSTAPFLGGFGAAAQGGDAKAAAAVAAKCWAVATPLGLVLRGLSKGYVPPTPFIIASLVTTGVLLVGWRAALAAVSKKDAAPTSAAAKIAARKDKQGGPFEFMQLLFSLTRRW